jgi:hypothetical protein
MLETVIIGSLVALNLTMGYFLVKTIVDFVRWFRENYRLVWRTK